MGYVQGQVSEKEKEDVCNSWGLLGSILETESE